MMAPCKKCGKLIVKGYAMSFYDALICDDCVKSDPKLMKLLTPKDRKKIGGRK